MKGTLHIVATPIGNLEDMTLRGIRVLQEVDLVLAEDTRHTRKLLDHHQISARPLSLHAHNEAARIERALDVLGGAGSVALVSDAGTPLISDPGERLVAAVAAAGHRVTPVPGASAVLAALSVSGLAVAPFTFLGFLPRKSGARHSLLAGYRDRPETLVLFESPRRLAGTLQDLAAALGDRPACVARELTKLHEEVARGSLAELAERFEAGARGEMTLVVAGAAPGEAAPDDEKIEADIREALAAGRPVKEIAAEIARGTGLPRREVYARVLTLRESDS
jgi:16S rRNA (cytidine1402-2'-O)-methyltransferase